MVKKANKDNALDDVVGYAIAGAGALGLGAGFLFENITAGVLIGGGIGLLVAASITAKRAK